MRRRLALAASVSALLCLPAPALAATGPQVRALALRAETSPAALAELLRIRVVDGRPANFRVALGHSSGVVLRARLRVLAGGGAAPALGQDETTAAQQILRERRFRGTAVPQPLHGALAWLGHQIARPFRWLAPHVPEGGSNVLWSILGVLVFVLAVVVAQRLARVRGGLRIEASDAIAREGRASPAELERAAERAEQAGDFALALRLRFRAGLLRLARARAIPERDSITSGEVRRALRSPDFDVLARSFDEVVYGGRSASAADVQAARAGWPRVLEAVRI